jgi:APA family basic amino acid/polyamine antiporter
MVFILAALALVVNTIVTQPRSAAVGLGIVMAGAPAYLIWRKRNKSLPQNEN